MPINLNSTLLLMLLLAFSYGCKKEEAPAPPPPAAKPAPAPKPVPPVQQQISSAAKVGSAVVFKKDPFKPLLTSQAPVVPAGQAAKPSGVPLADQLPIQSFEASKFKVAGIIAGFKENKALVIDPNGKGYVVQAGMQIGNANGRISRITSSSVEIVEKSGRKSKTIVLTLAKKR
ncbi:pilus assembly protein PilP [Geomonas propionica]|uniref:Pilus assembly protein PilP n=1 Tax=Geomonas propionica TaxID=2798582 RepID=A0ABS0YV83_9BACT|nr:pilus assembly protein PilP [Geomonas propionica]MBJ6801884.1 pilus assembly protein PilP [Geomonas propionica]